MLSRLMGRLAGTSVLNPMLLSMILSHSSMMDSRYKFRGGRKSVGGPKSAVRKRRKVRHNAARKARRRS